jgi:hypothetical protein
VYQDNCPKFKDWVNRFIELTELHRFKEDPEWGQVLLQLHNGEITDEVIDWVSKQVVTLSTVLPDDIKYATYQNRDHDATNAALFEERATHLHNKTGSTKDSILMFSENVMRQNGSKKYEPFRNVMAYWEHCREDNVKVAPCGNGKMDPVLRLHHSYRFMLPINKNMNEGQANGSQVTLEKVVFKPNVQHKTVMIGKNIPVQAACTNQVDHIVVCHTNDRVKPQVFSIKPKSHTFDARVPKPKSLQARDSEHATFSR